jgi:hypothetical protein
MYGDVQGTADTQEVSMIVYRNCKIEVVSEGSIFAVHVRTAKGKLVGSLPAYSIDGGLEDGKGLVDLRSRRQTK